jgi:hypothetical protein
MWGAAPGYDVWVVREDLVIGIAVILSHRTHARNRTSLKKGYRDCHSVQGLVCGSVVEFGRGIVGEPGR